MKWITLWCLVRNVAGLHHIGPPGPAGGEKDREVVSVDSRLLITRFVDPDAAKRYGCLVYVRCT
jgi:hypothetical protein